MSTTRHLLELYVGASPYDATARAALADLLAEEGAFPIEDAVRYALALALAAAYSRPDAAAHFRPERFGGPRTYRALLLGVATERVVHYHRPSRRTVPCPAGGLACDCREVDTRWDYVAPALVRDPGRAGWDPRIAVFTRAGWLRLVMDDPHGGTRCPGRVLAVWRVRRGAANRMLIRPESPPGERPLAAAVLAGFIGMKAATYANVRTSQSARTGNKADALLVALDGGAVGAAMGDRAIQAKPEAHPERPERKRGSPVHQAASFVVTPGAPG